MKLGLVSDLHFRGQDWKDQSAALDEALRQMNERGVGWLLCAGDVFDRPQISDRYATVGTLVRAVMSPLEKWGIPCLLVSGNHDRPAASKDESAIEVFRNHRLCRVVTTRPEHTRLRGDLNEEVCVACYPWLMKHNTPEGMNFEEWCAHELKRTTQKFQSQSASYKIFLAHCELEGSYSNYGFVLPGSTYCFTSRDLEGTGADLIALGHVHNRQSYYLGALIQLNFGEETNPTGWLYVDTLKNEHYYVSLPEPRKYYTVDIKHYDKTRYRSYDRIKVIGSELPKDLPEGVVFQFEASRKKTQKRIKNIASDQSLKELLDIWGEVNNVELSQRHYDELGKVVENVDSVYETNGSLDFIESILVEGVGPHKHIFYEFNPEQHWWAISGPNGAGKSTYLESILAGLYGKFAQKGRSLASMLSDERGRIQVVFWSRERKWEITRNLSRHGSRASHKVELRLVGSNEETYEGARPVSEKIEELVGPYELFLGSAFLAQSGSNDLVSLDESKRMSFVRRFLGLSKFDDLDNIVKTKLKDIESQHKSLARVLINPDDTLTIYRETEELLKTRREQKIQVQKDIEATRQQINDTQTALENLTEEVSAEIQEAMNRLHKNESRCRLIGREIYNTQRHIEAVEGKHKLELFTLQKQYKQIKEEGKSLSRVGCASIGLLDCCLIDNARNKLATLPDIGKRLKEKESLLKQKDWEPEFLETIYELESEKNTLTEQIKEDRILIEDHRKEQANGPKSVLKEKQRNLSHQLQRHMDKMADIASSIGCGKQVLRHADKLVEQDKKDREEFVRMEALLSIYQDLQKAVGKGGIPQLLISSMAPALQQTLDEVCKEDFNNRFHLRIDTLRELSSSDDKKETFTILFSKGDREYDVNSCSGGERAAVRAALRTALVVYQADTSNLGHRVCFLDEPTAHQDAENSEATLKMIERLSDRFRQVIFVSHQDSLLGGIPNHIRLGVAV